MFGYVGGAPGSEIDLEGVDFLKTVFEVEREAGGGGFDVGRQVMSIGQGQTPGHYLRCSAHAAVGWCCAYGCENLSSVSFEWFSKIRY